MQQTFEINTGQLSQIYDAVIAKFGNRKVKVMIEDVQQETAFGDQDQYRMFLQSEQLQKEYPPIRVSPDIDLSALANEVNL